MRRVETFNVFGRFYNYTQDLDNLAISEAENSFNINACKDYIENDDVATIRIYSLTQPNYEAATDSVKIRINTRNDEAIALIEEGVTFTPIRGEIVAESDATNYVVQSPTMVMLTLKPQHAIYVIDEPQI